MKDTIDYFLGKMILESPQNDQNFVARGRKDQAVFSPLVLSRGTEEVVQNWNGKSSQADRVRSGRIEVEGLCDFRRGLGLEIVKYFLK